MRERTLDGWFIDILPDLNQDDPEVARYIIQNSLWWVAMSGLDGIRQDTWPYVPRRFWRDWMAALKREFPRLTVVGEVFDGNPAIIAFFEGGRVKWDGLDDKVDAERFCEGNTFVVERNRFLSLDTQPALFERLGHDCFVN